MEAAGAESESKWKTINPDGFSQRQMPLVCAIDKTSVLIGGGCTACGSTILSDMIVLDTKRNKVRKTIFLSAQEEAPFKFNSVG